MASPLFVSRLNKTVRVWSGRRNREVTIQIDYHRVASGPFTLFHIERMFDADFARLPPVQPAGPETI